MLVINFAQSTFLALIGALINGYGFAIGKGAEKGNSRATTGRVSMPKAGVTVIRTALTDPMRPDAVSHFQKRIINLKSGIKST